MLVLPFVALTGALAVGLGAGFGRNHPLRHASTLGWLLAIGPAVAFALLLGTVPAIRAGTVITASVPWLPSLGLAFTLWLDGLALLFALLVTGIGTLIIIYAGAYMRGKADAWRFISYLLLFMIAMLGLVLAGDIITLFIFWEGTSLVSFLLVATKHYDPAARRGAFRALFITGGGGIALLAGLLVTAHAAGGSDFATILASGPALRAHALYPVMLGLVAFGAFTKSAQVPAHIWLPSAMSAPTPASAYLHSATMVKAGIYLLARLHPALGQTESWFWLLTTVGLVTMVTGAYLGVKQDDLKALLAYSTISQLGILVMLIGQDTEIAFKALVIGVVAHALYKSALFMLAGGIDLTVGTRRLSQLGGLRRAMPVTAVLVTIGALSLAGLPPLFGFLAKETLLATAVHPSLPQAVAWLVTGAVVVAAALKFIQAGMLTIDVFGGDRRGDGPPVRESAWPLWLMPGVPALLSLGLGVLPEPAVVADVLAKAAGAAYGAPVKVSLALWTGLNAPLLLSLVAIGGGALLFTRRAAIQAWQQRWTVEPFEQLYAATLDGLQQAARAATVLQQGRLRLYAGTVLAAALLLIWSAGGVPWPRGVSLTWPAWDAAGELALLRVFTSVVTVLAALATVLVRRDLVAILALGVAGLGIAVLMILEPAPDVALVQVVVDILSVVILVLALTRLPRAQRRLAERLNSAESPLSRALQTALAAAAGVVVTLISFNALVSRPRPSVVTPFYEAAAKPLTGAKDIVGAIIVDFRALDTLIEIAVFSIAGLGIYTLLRFATRKHGDVTSVASAPLRRHLPTRGIGGGAPSPFLALAAQLTLPLALVIAVTHVIYGHDQPGDGFTAGVIVSLAVGLWFVVFGWEETRARLPWLSGVPLIAAGVLLVLASGAAGALLNGAFLAPVDYGALLRLPLPQGFYLSSGFVFELAIALCVVGSVTLMLNVLGHPGAVAEAAAADDVSAEAGDVAQPASAD